LILTSRSHGVNFVPRGKLKSNLEAVSFFQSVLGALC
jgi:hypothetical protein